MSFFKLCSAFALAFLLTTQSFAGGSGGGSTTDSSGIPDKCSAVLEGVGKIAKGLLNISTEIAEGINTQLYGCPANSLGTLTNYLDVAYGLMKKVADAIGVWTAKCAPECYTNDKIAALNSAWDTVTLEYKACQNTHCSAESVNDVKKAIQALSTIAREIEYDALHRACPEKKGCLNGSCSDPTKT